MSQENNIPQDLNQEEILDLYADIDEALIEMAEYAGVDLTSLVDDDFEGEF